MLFRSGHALLKWPKRCWSKVTIVAGSCVHSEATNSQLLRQQVIALRGDKR